MHMLNIDIVDDARKTNSLTFVQHEGHGKLNASAFVSILPTCPIIFFGLLQYLLTKTS
jgi:hypothetical protein